LQVSGDQFEQVVREHQSLVFRTLIRLIGRSDRIEDLAQEVFLRLYRGLLKFRNDAKISTYLYRIIINVAQDEWKHRQRERVQLCSLSDPDEDWEGRIAHPGENAEQQLGHKQLWDAVQMGLMQLSDAERATIVLYHQEECSYEQISLVLNLPLGTVRTHLHRGREKLKQAVRESLKPDRREACVKTR
jgi:RNA polymerase sigma-70 factor (ECF subfamily)